MPEENNFPAPVRAALSQTDKADREARFLRSAALLYVWQRAGQKALKADLPELPSAPLETRPFCSPAYRPLLKKILANPGFYGPITGFLINRIHQKGLVVPHEHLVPLLNVGTSTAFKKYKTAIYAILGERGRWLALQNPVWHPLLESETIQKWEEGSAAERKQYLAALRKVDPQKSVALLESAWPTENVRERKDLLGLLAVAPSPEEVSFVERVFVSLQALPDGAKPLHLELKHLAASILLGAPGSALFQDVVGRLRPYFQRPPKRMGLQQKIKINLPRERDEFFNADRMAKQFGFDDTSPYAHCSEPEYWCGELIGLLHPLAWETIVDPDWHKILDFFATAGTYMGKKQWPLLQHISRALAQTQYLPGIRAYLNKYPVNAANFTMLHALSNEALEAWFRHQTDLEQAGLVRTTLDRPGWVWSYTLSKQLLHSLLQEDNISHHAEFAKSICLHFNAGIMADLEAFQQHENMRRQKTQNQKLQTCHIHQQE